MLVSALEGLPLINKLMVMKQTLCQAIILCYYMKGGVASMGYYHSSISSLSRHTHVIDLVCSMVYMTDGCYYMKKHLVNHFPLNHVTITSKQTNICAFRFNKEEILWSSSTWLCLWSWRGRWERPQTYRTRTDGSYCRTHSSPTETQGSKPSVPGRHATDHCRNISVHFLQYPMGLWSRTSLLQWRELRVSNIRGSFSSSEW